MNRTSIEWVKNPDGTQGYTWNPITGCLNNCSYCYARKLANGRLKTRYLANSCLPTHDEPDHEAHHSDAFYPRFWQHRVDNFTRYGRARGIFVCDMGELFGDWIPGWWQNAIFSVIKECHWHRFYLLTKQPQNLIKFSPFPENCWPGVTATNQKQFNDALWHLQDIKATIKFLSLEPLLERPFEDGVKPDYSHYLQVYGINWVIIGACTGTLEDIKRACVYTDKALKPMPYGKRWTLQPKLDWVEEIVRACDKAGIAVFLKDNLAPGLEVREPFIEVTKEYRKYPRQEMAK